MAWNGERCNGAGRYFQGRWKVLGGGAAIGRRVEAVKRLSNFLRFARKIFLGGYFFMIRKLLT